MRKIILVRYIIFPLTFLLILSCNKQVSISEPDKPVSLNKIIIESDPPGAAIYLDYNNTGKVTPDSIPYLEAGDYNILLRKDLFLDTTFAFTLESNSQKYIYVNYYEDARNYGFIKCISDPEGSDIYINDSLTGKKTPYIFNFIWPDNYEIKYSYPIHRTDSCTITVPAQDTTLAYIKLQDTTYAVDYSFRNSDLPNTYFYAIDVDQNDKKWIGTRGGGIIYHDDENWVHYYSHNSSIPSNFVYCITVDSRNRKWIGTLNGVLLIDENGTWTTFNPNNSNLPASGVTEIKEDSNGIIWIGVGDYLGVKALSKYDGVNFTNYLVEKRITAMAIDKQNRVWLGLDNEIRILDGTDWRNDITDTMRTQNKYVDAIACDNYGRIIFSTQHIPRVSRIVPDGLYVYDPSDLSLTRIFSTPVSHINVTDKGNIWICIWGKIGLLDPPTNVPILYKMDHQFNIQEYTMDSSTIPGFYLVCSAEQSNGDLWFAARYTGVIKFKKVDL